MNHCQHPQSQESARTRLLKNVAIAIGLGLMGFYLITEHRAHLYGALPFLLILSCPLMHLFMHHDHGGHDHSSRHEAGDDSDSKSKPVGPTSRGAGK